MRFRSKYHLAAYLLDEVRSGLDRRPGPIEGMLLTMLCAHHADRLWRDHA